MATKTPIEWTDLAANPIHARDKLTGKAGWFCEHASAGCIFCYSETRNRWIGNKIPYNRQNRDLVEIFFDEKQLRMPKRPAKVFLCDMTDIFADFVTDDMLDRIFASVAQHPQHVYQTLTKRPERQRDYFTRHPAPPNLWVGSSIEQRRPLDRLDTLRTTDAAIRFISFEPLLEDLGTIDLTGIDWVIAGAESDAWRRARPMQLGWVRHIRDQCIAAGVPFFFKQDAVRGRKIPVPVLDGRQWRQFPIA
jgi:protein gp37